MRQLHGRPRFIASASSLPFCRSISSSTSRIWIDERSSVCTWPSTYVSTASCGDGASPSFGSGSSFRLNSSFGDASRTILVAAVCSNAPVVAVVLSGQNSTCNFRRYFALG